MTGGASSCPGGWGTVADMAVTLSASLAAHQQSRSRRPILRAEAWGTRAGSEVLRWTRIYAGSEADNPHALATIASGGSQHVIRARNTGGTVYASSQDYNAGPNWSTSSYGDATASQPMELAALGEHLSLCQGSNKRWSTLRYLGGNPHIHLIKDNGDGSALYELTP